MSADPAETSGLAAATVGAIADAAVTLDTKGVITSWNPSAESLFGHPASEMVGATLATVIPGEFRARHRAGFHAAIDSGALSHHGRPARVQAMTAGVDVAPLAMTLGLLTGPGGAVTGVLSVLRRLTELETFA
jgi:PAS domain S-box-containing protein